MCNRRIGESNLYREMKRKTDNTETREIVANQWFVLKTADLTELNRVEKSFFRLLTLLFSMLLFSFDGLIFFAQSNKSNWFPGSGLYFQQFSGGGGQSYLKYITISHESWPNFGLCRRKGDAGIFITENGFDKKKMKFLIVFFRPLQFYNV